LETFCNSPKFNFSSLCTTNGYGNFLCWHYL